MSDTPRTDAEEQWAEWNGNEFKCVPVEFARELERELAAGAKREHVAWLRFNDYNGARAATIHVCDSDAPGAFKVYR